LLDEQRLLMSHASDYLLANAVQLKDRTEMINQEMQGRNRSLNQQLRRGNNAKRLFQIFIDFTLVQILLLLK